LWNRLDELRDKITNKYDEKIAVCAFRDFNSHLFMQESDRSERREFRQRHRAKLFGTGHLHRRLRCFLSRGRALYKSSDSGGSRAIVDSSNPKSVNDPAISGLTKGGNYDFIVTAVNPKGESLESARLSLLVQ